MEYFTACVDTGRFSMDYIKFGKGSRTLVILPGLSVQSVIPSAGTIAQAYQVFTNDFTVYLFDRRKPLPAQYSVAQMAQDSYDAMQQLGLSNICLFGTSQGGMIAMTLAVKYPLFIQSLILGSTACKMTPEDYAIVNHWVEAAKAGDKEALYLSFAAAIYPKEMFEQYRRAFLLLANNVSQDDLNRFVILAEAMRGFDLSNQLQRIQCPVLLLNAKDDRVLPPDAADLIKAHLQYKSDFECFLYEGYGHAAYDTAPDYKDRMLQFLKKSFD